MDKRSSTVFVVDDDESVRGALRRLLEAHQLTVRTWSSTQSFLDEHDPSEPGCVLTDLAMPGMDGLDLQEALARIDPQRPVIFLTGQGDVPASVRAMKAGAVGFLQKPVQPVLLLDEIRTALERDAAARETDRHLAALRTRLRSLTPRELDVLELIVAGRLTKQIAAELGTAEKTIKVHRGRVMHKMGARTVADLVALAADAGIRRSS
jgi:FixJ family two-component response regulator